MLSDDNIKESIKGTTLSYENGFSLFKAATLLYENRFYPSSIALGVLAIEELGKTHIISRSIYLDENDKNSRKKWYHNKFKNHINKSGNAIYNYKYVKELINKEIINTNSELDAIFNAKIRVHSL